MAAQPTRSRAIGSILCPVDFSTNSRAALRYAAMLARMADGHLIVLYVDDPLLATAAARRRGARAMIAGTEHDLHRFVETTLGRVTARPSMTVLTVPGKPAECIVRTAAEHRCDLIVIGYRGAGRASRLLFGSTTEGVMRKAVIPVVAVPPGRRSAGAADRAHMKRAS